VKSLQEIYDQMRPFYLSDEQVALRAYSFWVREGRPDGEQINGFGFKIKDFHWMRAIWLQEALCDAQAAFVHDIQQWNQPVVHTPVLSPVRCSLAMSHPPHDQCDGNPNGEWRWPNLEEAMGPPTEN